MAHSQPLYFREEAIMPFSSSNDLPEDIRHNLPEHAQHTFIKTFNNACTEYEDPKNRRTDESLEKVAFKVAWSTVKREYEKSDDDKWHPKGKLQS